MSASRPVDVHRLYRDVQWALEQELDERDLLPMLEELAHHAPAATEIGAFARLELASAVMEREPWRAARFAADVLALSDIEHAWGLLGLAHTLLDNPRCAVRAYGRALRASPRNPSYLHNLGHLLDVAFGRPASALRWLEAACREAPDDCEIRASLAHALLRAGRQEEARLELEKALGRRRGEAERILHGWSRAVVRVGRSTPETDAGLADRAVDG